MEDNVSFIKWLWRDRYINFLAVFCAIIPFILEKLGKAIPSSIINVDIEINSIYCISNIVIVVFAIIAFGRVKFLLDKGDSGRSHRLIGYVKKEFGANSALYLEGEDALFGRMAISFRQFYYSWMAVWTTWFIFYFCKLVFSFHKETDPCMMVCYPNLINHNQFILENSLNLLGSLFFFFIYLVITVSTVRQLNKENNLGVMLGYILLLICFGVCCMIVDYNASYLSGEDYFIVEFIVQLLIAFVACISMMAVLGRLNSGYLGIPQWMIFTLYLYAALQMLYPLTIFKEWMAYSNLDTISQFLDKGVKCLYFFALFGKICLFLTIKWVMQERRFLFFLINKAHVLAEADKMQAEFGKDYEKTR